MSSQVILQSRDGQTIAGGPIWSTACFVNKVLLEHSRDYLFAYYLSLLSPYNGSIELLQ